MDSYKEPLSLFLLVSHYSFFFITRYVTRPILLRPRLVAILEYLKASSRYIPSDPQDNFQ